MIIRSSPPSRAVTTAHGFSLIEILVVIAVISVLAAIAIPQFTGYRTHAFDAQMKTDLKNASVAMESYYAEYKVYPATVAAISAAGFRQTTGVGLVITVTSPSTFTLTASTPNGSQ